MGRAAAPALQVRDSGLWGWDRLLKWGERSLSQRPCASTAVTAVMSAPLSCLRAPRGPSPGLGYLVIPAPTHRPCVLCCVDGTGRPR